MVSAKGRRRMLASAAAAALSLVAPVLARANVVDVEIGIQAQNERLCESGHPINAPHFWTEAPGKIEALMQAYPTVAASNDAKLREAFALNDNGGVYGLDDKEPPRGSVTDAWLSASGTSGSRLIPAEFKLKRLVVAFDVSTARGVWSASRPSSTDPNAADEVDYVVDFNVTGLIVRDHWKIWRIRLFKPSELPSFPDKYCHRNEIAPLW